MAFIHREYYEERSRGDAGLHSQSYRAQLNRSGSAQIASVWVGLRRSSRQTTARPEQSKDSSAVHRERSRSHTSRRLGVGANHEERCVTVAPWLS